MLAVWLVPVYWPGEIKVYFKIQPCALLPVRVCFQHVLDSGFAALGLELDCNKNEIIFEQLLGLDPNEVIAKVLFKAEYCCKKYCRVAIATVPLFASLCNVQTASELFIFEIYQVILS